MAPSCRRATYSLKAFGAVGPPAGAITFLWELHCVSIGVPTSRTINVQWRVHYHERLLMNDYCSTFDKCSDKKTGIISTLNRDS